MQIRDVMTREVQVLRPETSLFEAAALMKRLDVGVIPICDGERLVGMLTDRDIVIRAVAEAQDPALITAADAMTPEVVYCFDDQPLEEAARLMQDRQIRRLPIVNRDKRLVGIVALGDLAVESQDTRQVGQTLEGVSQPAQPKG